MRRTLAGEFVCVSRHLLNDLIALGLWNPQLKDAIIAANGSVQQIDCIPAELKLLYRTVWEISQKAVIDMAADRGAYIDQSQSLNIHMPNVNTAKLTSMHFYAWRKGLKTGMYYLRTKSAADAVKVTLDPATAQQTAPQPVSAPAAAAASRAVSPSPAPLPPAAAAAAAFAAAPALPADPEDAAAAAAWRAEREKQREMLECSLSNKDACLCCSS